MPKECNVGLELLNVVRYDCSVQVTILLLQHNVVLIKFESFINLCISY